VGVEVVLVEAGCGVGRGPEFDWIGDDGEEEKASG